MIKKLLFGLGLSVISLFSLVSSDFIVRQNGYYGYSPLDNSINLNVVNKGQLMSERFGQTQRFLAFSSSENNHVYFLWSLLSKPYLLVNYAGHRYQGFLKTYFLCDEIFFSGTGNSSPGNCTTHNVTDNFGVEMGGFFDSITINDYWGFDIHTWDCYGSTQINNSFCFSSSKYHKSVCFSAGAGNEVCACNNCHNLTGTLSLSYDTDFTSVSPAYIGTPPGFQSAGGSSSGNMDGAIDVNLNNNNLSGDYVYSSCTWDEIITLMESEGYNKYICYGGLNNFDDYDSSINYNPIAGAGLSLQQIWSWSGSRAWDTFSDWFYFWNGLYLDTSDNNYNAMWESYPAVYYTYFQLYNSYKGSALNPRYVLEYCQLKTLSGDLLNNSAGGIFKPFCENIIREKQTGIWDTRVDGTIYSGGVYTGNVGISVNWNGVGNMSGQIQSDGLNFIQNYFNLVKSKISTDYNNGIVGIVPGYIIVFMLGLILFRFFQH